jgi:vanillate/4-hydroxybenzoate decarboxylase subunit C
LAEEPPRDQVIRYAKIHGTKDINLFDLMPLFRLNRGDGASTSTTWRMSGVYRLMVKGPNRIGIQTMPQRDISVQLAR